MEEINIFLNNKISIYYLSLFDNIIKDENNFKIGNFILNDNNDLNINYDNGKNDSFKFLKDENNIKYFGEMNIINNDENKIKICHNYWEDELLLKNNICYRTSNHDKGKFILNEDEINIKWDDYNQEKFKLNEKENKYYIIEQKNDNTKVYVKNFSWENDIILYKNENKCVRLNKTKDKGDYILNGNYLYIYWLDWDNEVFYKIENIYYNNKKFTNNIKIIINDKQESYLYDKEFIYINDDQKYKYIIENKKLIINEYEYKEFIFLDDEYHYINYFKQYKILDKTYLFYNNENIILNHFHIIIGKYNNIINNIIKIEWYNEDKNYYKINENNLKNLNIFLLKNENVETYYNLDDLLYDESFKNIIKFQQISNEEIILENNLRYKKENDIYILIKDSNKKEIILLNDILQTYYYDNNTLFNSNTRYICLTDDNYMEIYIKIKGQIQIYYKLYDNVYINNHNYELIKKYYFDNIIYKYFENKLDNHLIEDIVNKNIVCSENTFEYKFLFLENINFEFYFNNQYDIFENYGYFIIQENNINLIEKTELIIINFNKNEDFMDNQEQWFDYLENNKKNLILIFDDFSYYEFINEIFNFSENYSNYIILINYSKSSCLIHFYLNKLIKNIDKNEFITKVNYITNINNKVKNIKKQDEIVINKNYFNFIYNKIDFVIFMIYFYIKNKNAFILDSDFIININLYKKLLI